MSPASEPPSVDTSGARTPGIYRFLAGIVKPFLRVFTRRVYTGVENVPSTGGFIAVSNHVSGYDPLTLMHFLFDAKRPPKIMAKSSLFRIPVVGWALRVTGQIKVERSKNPTGAIAPAVAAAKAGACVALFPEGTFTRDPDMWPMKAKTGAVRIALMAGVPIIPIAQWGAQDFLPREGGFPHFIPRATVKVVAGPPIDLSDLPVPGDDQASPEEAAALREGTDRVMKVLTTMVGELRGLTPPADAEGS